MIDYTENGKCAKECGRCCSRVLPLNDHEIKKIKQYIRRNNIIPTHLNSKACPFLNENKECQVYVHRGEICKSFICNKHLEIFNHRDKRMIDLWEEFYPDMAKDLMQIDIEQIDNLYQFKKKEAYKNI